MAEPLRVLVTRPQPGRLGTALAHRGFHVVHLPLVRLVPTGTPPPFDVPPSDGVLVTSAAVARLAPHALVWMRDARFVVAVGHATARSLEPIPCHIADGTGAAALDCFRGCATPTFVGAARPATHLARAIATGRVLHWPVYDRERIPVNTVPPVDVVTLASPSTARAWAAIDPGPIPCVVIGPTTEAAAREAGLPVQAVAERPTMEALAEAILTDTSAG